MNYPLISRVLKLINFPISYHLSENFFNYWENTQADYDIEIRVNTVKFFQENTDIQ